MEDRYCVLYICHSKLEQRLNNLQNRPFTNQKRIPVLFIRGTRRVVPYFPYLPTTASTGEKRNFRVRFWLWLFSVFNFFFLNSTGIIADSIVYIKCSISNLRLCDKLKSSLLPPQCLDQMIDDSRTYYPLLCIKKKPCRGSRSTTVYLHIKKKKKCK